MRNRTQSLEILSPAPVMPGATVGIISPSSPPPDVSKFDTGIAALEHLGYRVKLGKHARKRNGFLAGTDRERAADLMGMFADSKVDAILCARGGYGTPRLLPLLDYRLIRRNAKAFVGYSDITALHCAFLAAAGLQTFHGPHLVGDFARTPLDAFTVQSFQHALAGGAGDIAAGYRQKSQAAWSRGTARGRLIGGNLSLLCSLVGTPWLPDFSRRILFIEDIGEPPYRFDRMLTQLLNAGLLQRVAGIAIGLNADCEDPKAADSKEYRQTVDEVLRERLKPLGVPVVSGLPFGHVPTNATLRTGAIATLDTRSASLSLV
jgi:muramoyltetrapeptide carboxypeptidase